jgi:hypothetical protein
MTQMEHHFEEYPNWQPEELVDKGVATLIHKYLKVKNSVWSGVGCLEIVIHLLNKWAEKEQKATDTQSLMRKSLVGSIMMLPNILTHLESLNEQLPRKAPIWRDYGISTPQPEINIAFNPRDIHFVSTLQTLKEQFDVLLLFMELVNNLATKEDTNTPSTEPDVFWRDVASTNGVTKKRTAEQIGIEGLPPHFVEIPSVEAIKTKWHENLLHLIEVIQHIQSFLTDTQQKSEDNPNQETDISQNLTQQAKLNRLLDKLTYIGCN